jgi:branched-chain amino acid transport system substrate-binding protein
LGERVRIGVLYSASGAYASIGRDCLDGARLGLADAVAAAGPDAPAIEPVFVDPEGDLNRYGTEARRLLREDGCRHILGTITSAARKEVIPLVEKHDGLLWYVCPYEGFEASESVIYAGACPNQHLLPLLDHVMPRYGGQAFLVGANYVWGWETNRLARQILRETGGDVLGERYLPLDDTEVERLVAEIAAKRPDFVLNNLVGPSSYAFLRAYRRLGDQDERFRPQRRPVVSCNLTECELPAIGAGVADGNISAAPYFESVPGPRNAAFRQAIGSRLGAGRPVSAFMATAYASARILVETIVGLGTDDPAAVRERIAEGTHETVLGDIAIDPVTNHATLPVHLARIGGAGFGIVASRQAIVADPYLARERPARGPGGQHLRVVS